MLLRTTRLAESRFNDFVYVCMHALLAGPVALLSSVGRHGCVCLIRPVIKLSGLYLDTASVSNERTSSNICVLLHVFPLGGIGAVCAALGQYSLADPPCPLGVTLEVIFHDRQGA